MAQQTLNSNSVEPLGGPNTGLSTELGDGWNSVISKLTTMFNDIYGNAANIASANRRGALIGLSTQVTTFTSAATNTAQTAFSYVLPASTLAATGCGLYVETWGKVASNAAPKNITLNVGGASLASGTFTLSGASWSTDAYYFKTGSNTQNALLEGWTGSTRVASTATTDTSVDTGTIGITVVVTDASAATGNVIVMGLIVQFMP